MTIRTLQAAADRDAARAASAALAGLPDTEPGAVLADSGELLAELGRLAAAGVADLPEVVLVHDGIGPMPALELVREVALRFPAVGVVLLTADSGPALYSAAMAAGARGLVVLPLDQGELAARVRAAAAWAAGVRRHLDGGGRQDGRPGGMVVAVCGAKGGVGTTVTAIQLALAARGAGRTVALADLDLQSGDVASYLDVRFRRSVADLAEISELSPRVLGEAMFDHPSGVALLLAPAEGEQGEALTDRAARQILAALRARFEVVVADCGTQMTGANAVAVEAADTALLITTPDVVAVRAAKRMLRLWDRLRIRAAHDTRLVLNRAGRGSEIQPALIERITGAKAAATAVPAAFKELQPVVDSGRMDELDPRSAVRQALWALAAELGIAGPADGSAPAPGGPARILPRPRRRGERRAGRRSAGREGAG